MPVDSGEREGIASRDLVLDGRVRVDVRVTLILDPAEGLYCWVHYAPPINDSFRVSYRKLLRWNDEIPFIKFAVADDDRPVLLAEVPAALLSEEALGRALARLLTVCDLLYPASLTWLHPGARRAPASARAPRHLALLDRYAAELGELAAAAGAA
ncbi:MAG: YbjN domain-containing protein, partial [Chloroflexota bacterium]